MQIQVIKPIIKKLLKLLTPEERKHAAVLLVMIMLMGHQVILLKHTAKLQD